MRFSALKPPFFSDGLFGQSLVAMDFDFYRNSLTKNIRHHIWRHQIRTLIDIKLINYTSKYIILIETYDFNILIYISTIVISPKFIPVSLTYLFVLLFHPQFSRRVQTHPFLEKHDGYDASGACSNSTASSAARRNWRPRRLLGRAPPWRPRDFYLEDHLRTCKWLVTPIYKPFRPFVRGRTLLRGLTNHGY